MNLEATAAGASALAFFDVSADGFLLLAPVQVGGDLVDFEYRYANPASYRILGHAPGALLGRRMTEVYSAARTSGFFDRYREAFLTGKTQSFEAHYGGDSLDRWFRVTTTRTGELLAIAFADVTEARLADQRARDEAALNETLVRVGNALAAENDLKSIVQRITDESTAICRAQFGAFFYNVTNERGDAFLLYTLSGAPKEAFSSFPLPRATPLFGYTFRGEGILRLDDVRKDPRFGAWGPQPKGHLPVVSYLAVPVISREGKVHGGLFFGHEKPGIFTEREERVVAAIAAQAAVAIDRARLHEERETFRQEAQSQRDRLERVFQRAPVAVAVLRGPQHVYELANPSYRALVSRDGLEGKTIREAFPELAGQGIYELLDQVFTRGERFVGSEVPLKLTRDGVLQDGYFNFVYEPMFDRTGKCEGIMVVATEVTDFVVSRKRVQESEERFRSLVTATSLMVWRTNAQGEVVADSPSWRGFTGQSVEQWKGYGWLDALHPEDRAAAEDAWRKAVEKKSLYEVEYRVRRHDGVYRATIARGAPVLEPDGSVREWVGTNTDITERRLAEENVRFLSRVGEALVGARDPEATLRTLVRLTVPGIADWAWLDVFDDAGAARRVDVAHHDDDGAKIAEALRTFPVDLDRQHPASRVLESGRTVLLTHLTDDVLRRGARSPEHYELVRAILGESAMLVPINTHGRVRAVMTLVTTHASGRTYGAREQAVAEELGRRASLALENAYLLAEAQAARTRAEQANHAKDEFLATMSHELRTPLNAMLGWVRLLRMGALDETKQARALETIERNAKAQAQLVDDVLDVSRIVTGKLRLNVVEVDVLKVVEAAIDVVRPAADAKGVRLQAVLDPDAGVLRGDPDRMQQVYWNLLTNAIKFTPKGGRVFVRLERRESSVEVVVEDSGQGIHASFLPYVFERFRQADAAITRAHGGLGLGLAIVKHLVELHGGTVEALSDGEGKGATFVVRFPITPLRDAKREPAVAARNGVAGNPLDCPPGVDGLHVLVVDDEADARDLLDTVLRHCNAKTVTAASAREALRALDAQRFDVIVSDVGMPDEDGYALMRAVRARPAEKGGRTPAVALTAFARAEDRTRALLAGFNSHVAKPVEPSELLVVIANLAGRFGGG